MGIKEQVARFHYDQDAIFSGQAINRGRPLKFKFEGDTIFGFEGDTILSALLANGINVVGETQFGPVALAPSFCPSVIIKDKAGNAKTYPMERTPALDGLEIQLNRPDSSTTPQTKPTFLQSIFRKKTNSLGFDLDEGFMLARPRYDEKSDETIEFDLVIIGGGIAGLSAARTALENGLRVALLEKQTVLGGDAKFFGAIEGEKRPNEVVDILRRDVEGHENFSLFLRTEVISLNSRYARGHIIAASKGQISSRIVDYHARFFMLATGVLERLPVFSGNRLPGVCGARSAFELAAKYGVWPGKSIAFCTSTSPATQVALFAGDMGIKVKKLTDSRPNPKSRFFEFAKAYGISLATGTQVYQAALENNNQLNVQFGLSGDAETSTGDPLIVDRLIVCGGWQPDLSLWHASGGKTVWNKNHQQLQAIGSQNNIFLAGSNCGVKGMTECEISGRKTVIQLLGMEATEKSVAAKYSDFESEDGQLPVSDPVPDIQNCYLDAGYSLNLPIPKIKKGFWNKLFFTSKNKDATLLEASSENSLGDVVAKVILGEIPAEFAGIFAQERCGVRTELGQNNQKSDATNQKRTKKANTLPRYLVGRFGKNPHSVMLRLSDNSRVEAGCLIFKNHEFSTPNSAIGVVFGVCPDDTNLAFAYIEASEGEANSQLVIRHGTHTTTAIVD